MCSASVPSNTMCTVSFMSASRNAPRRSVTVRYQFSFASMQHYIIMPHGRGAGVFFLSVLMLWSAISAPPCLHGAFSFFFDEQYMSTFCMSSHVKSSFILASLPSCHVKLPFLHYSAIHFLSESLYTCLCAHLCHHDV